MCSNLLPPPALAADFALQATYSLQTNPSDIPSGMWELTQVEQPTGSEKYMGRIVLQGTAWHCWWSDQRESFLAQTVEPPEDVL